VKNNPIKNRVINHGNFVILFLLLFENISNKKRHMSHPPNPKNKI